MRRFGRFNPDAPVWQQYLYILFSVGGIGILFLAIFANRSCTQHELGDEARQVGMERCLAAEYSEASCAGYIEANHDDCIRGSIDYPGRFESHDPFLKKDRYYVCVMLGKEGYRAWRRSVYQAEQNKETPPRPPMPGQ